MTRPATTLPTPFLLNLCLSEALDQGESGLDALQVRLSDGGAIGQVQRRDRVLTLATAYGLLAGPVTPRSRLAGHPLVASLRWSLERAWLDELEAVDLPSRLGVAGDPVESVVSGMRWLAAQDRLPRVYIWVAKTASYDDVVRFLTLEGGPDAGFDDLVAACQVGLDGPAKLELAVNYWDEMGCGNAVDVHTAEHTRMADSLSMRSVPIAEQSTEALERSVFCSFLAANHWLQPEMLGALGLIELQAGPRCRHVVQGLIRVGAPAASLRFYEVHADVDPRHGNDWLLKAIAPVVTERPHWAARVLRGAAWRSRLNAEFLGGLDHLMALDAVAA